MPRTVQIRTSYQADIGFLTRLAQAVEKDVKLNHALKREIMTSLNNSALLFHKAEASRFEKENQLELGLAKKRNTRIKKSA